MNEHKLGGNLISWIEHLIPLIIALGLFLPILFIEKNLVYMILLFLVFLVSAFVDKAPKRGIVIGYITVVVMSAINFAVWLFYKKFEALVYENGNAVIMLFPKPLNPLLFIIVISAVIFVPILIMNIIRKRNSLVQNKVN